MTNIRGVEKAAILMMILNENIASKVFSALEDDEIREISQAMATLGSIASDTIEEVIGDFNSEINETLSFVGNIQSTERFLRKIMGRDKVDSILEDIRGPAGRNIWDKLGNVSEELLANYIKNEYPQTAALILSKLGPTQTANVLNSLSPEFAFEIMKRMVTLDTIKKEVLERVEKTLRADFISSLTKAQKQDNDQVIAEIFNNFDRSTESKFMGMFEEYSTEIADKIKSLMFTFEDIKKLDDAGLQAVLKVADKNKLTYALKGASQTIRDLFIKNMSQRASKILLEEIEGMGPVRLKEVEEAQSSIISVIKDLINKGEIEIKSSDDSDQLVY